MEHIVYSEGEWNNSIRYLNDEDGNVLKSGGTVPPGEEEDDFEFAFTYEYEFDEIGNWIKQIKFRDDDPEEIALRRIVYY